MLLLSAVTPTLLFGEMPRAFLPKRKLMIVDNDYEFFTFAHVKRESFTLFFTGTYMTN